MTIFKDGMLLNRLPMVTTDPTKLEEQARQHMKSRSFDYFFATLRVYTSSHMMAM